MSLKLINFNKNCVITLFVLILFLLSCGVVYAVDEEASFSNNEMISDTCSDSITNLETNDISSDNSLDNYAVGDDENALQEDIGDVNSPNDSNYMNLYYDSDHYVLEGNSFESIQYAIDNVEDNSYIKLCGKDAEGVPSNFNGNGTEIIINKSITLDGCGNLLDARSCSRIFNIVSDNVSLVNLNLINANHRQAHGFGLITDDESSVPQYIQGSVGGNGGVIKWLGNNGCLKNTIFNNNVYTGLESNGRVISWIGKNGTIIDSYFGFNPSEYLYPPELRNGTSIIDALVYGDYIGDLNENYVLIRNASVNIAPNVSVGDISRYFDSDDKVSFKLSNEDGVIFANETVSISIFNSKYNYTFNSTSKSDGLVSFSLKKVPVGNYSISINYSHFLLVDNFGDIFYQTETLSFNSSLKVLKIPVKFVISNYKTYYNSGKIYSVKVLNSKTNATLSGIKVALKIFTGNKYKVLNATTNSKGIASFSPSKNSVGSHKISISATGNVVDTIKNSSIDISKISTVVKLSKTSFKYKKSDYLKITLKDKNTKKVISGLKVMLKVYTGKSYKTYNLNTDKNGMLKINTKALNKGSHKLLISSNSKYYLVTKSTSIKIK